MGLDTFAQSNIRGKKINAKPYQGLRLCGGMFSDGHVGIRGKVYAEFVEKVTGVSLYEESIGNETVKVMADKLEAWAKETKKRKDEENTDPAYDGGWGGTYGELRDLVKWFRITADMGYIVVGWW